MRLLMQTVLDANSLPPVLARGLAGTDCELHKFLHEPPRPSQLRMVLRNLAPGLAFAEFNAELLSTAGEVEPVAIWLFKGMEVYPKTLATLRKRGITLVNYNADHPFEYFSRGSGNSNVRRAIPQYHLHLTYSERIKRQMEERFSDCRVGVVPFGHDVDEESFDRLRDEEEVVRACFLGNPDDHRARNIKNIIEADIPIDVFGHRWDRFLKPAPLLRINPQANGVDMLRTLRRYRVQLNFFRPHNEGSHNMRSFEVPACGGIMVAEDSVEHRAFFESGREAFYFRSPSEMVDCVRSLLARPVAEANEIRTAARRRSVRSGYTYRDRALAAYGLIRESVQDHRATAPIPTAST